MTTLSSVDPAGQKTGCGASVVDSFGVIWTAWNEQLGATIATILALIALLKSMGKEIQQIGSAIWRWQGWTIVSKLCRKAKILYRVSRAKSVMRQTLEENWVRIGIGEYGHCLQEDPSKSTRRQLNEITPAHPFWLNDYYVAAALESLSTEGSVVKATRYSVKSWPPKPEAYSFMAVTADRSAYQEAVRIETNDKCVVYQSFQLCPRPSRFEPQSSAETISPRETRFKTTFPLKNMAPPCELCWEREHRERDMRTLVDNITKYDFAAITTLEITGTNGELQEAVADVCIESQYPAEVNLIKPVVKEAIDIRQRQIAPCTPRLEHEWREGEKEEIVSALKEYIKSQPTKTVPGGGEV